jgi:integrase
MPRQRSGSIVRRRGAWWARIVFTDSTGKRRERWRRSDTKAGATDLRDQLLREIDDRGVDVFEQRERTFAELADSYERQHAKPAEYRDGAKVAGLRSYARVRGQIVTLRSFFGERSLRSIRYSDLDDLRIRRLDQRIVFRRKKANDGDAPKSRARSVADVNRLLALLRRMLNFAVQSGWIVGNPFSAGPSLVRTSQERKRERILSRDEERRLLAKCDFERRYRLRAVLITLLDTGLRMGELLKLTWADVDMKRSRIVVRAMNAKTLRAREVPMTSRVRFEFERMAAVGAEPSARVFRVQDNVRTSFESACKEAQIQDLRFHDLRHTAGTRMVEGGLSIAEVARILGHSQLSTAYRYVNANDETLVRATHALEKTHRDAERATKVKPVRSSARGRNGVRAVN